MTDEQQRPTAPPASEATAWTSDGAVSPEVIPGAPVTATAAALSDGEWHRLHPASPLLKGGIAFLAIVGIIIANLRERLLEIFVPQLDGYQGDPIDLIVENDLIPIAALAALVVLVVIIGLFYLSWRMHTFRITAEVVEVRSGVLFRTNRKARLDRIQGINIERKLFPRLFGAAKLEVSQAGQDANVKLEYLASGAADDLRREILRLASGTRAAASARAAGNGGQSVVERRVDEFLAPELDPDAAEPESAVKLSVGRLVGSTVLSGSTVFIVVAVVVLVVVSIVNVEALLGFVFLIPTAIAMIGFSVRRVTKSLRYTIASTPDGVRVGFGLLSTSNETLPPGRIHSVLVRQPLLWRGPGWWEVKVNRASHSSTNGAAGQQNTTILPVGDLGDVTRVLGLVLPDFLDPAAIELAEHGLTAPGGPDDGFTNSPRRAAWLRWFSWRRNGFAVTASAVLIRKGAIWRELVIVPHPRLQSVAIAAGPLYRAMHLVGAQLHTVSGPITPSLGAIDRDAGIRFFRDVAGAAIEGAARDATHRWRSGESDAAAPPTAAHAVWPTSVPAPVQASDLPSAPAPSATAPPSPAGPPPTP